jgi:hypothetical protein
MAIDIRNLAIRFNRHLAIICVIGAFATFFYVKHMTSRAFPRL